MEDSEVRLPLSSPLHASDEKTNVGQVQARLISDTSRDLQ